MAKRKSRGEAVERLISVDSSNSDSENTAGSTSGCCFDAAVPRQPKKIDTKTFEHYLGILKKNFSKRKNPSFVFLDCLWFTLYMQKPTKERVLTWIKNKRILTKKYVVVPIVCWSHWNLLILCHLGGGSSQSNTGTRCMLLLDSLLMSDPKRLEPDIRKFVMGIYEVENKPHKEAEVREIPLLIPKVPQQRNADDCGLFVLYFLKLFVQNAPVNFSHHGYPYFMKEDWFSHEDLDRFYSELSQCSQ
ncbi:hypothetical protein SAY86_006398 [Trapa natans]|uniref:Ubiquitin-like protease family profile domain-containing protein n=1 Tax=Trapa natans TaxID=22666 RepID=A0AAN7LBZ1_TRANT|nr:hypothetical protein SAY86_006398 [Trapa natans]